MIVELEAAHDSLNYILISIVHAVSIQFVYYFIALEEDIT